MRSATVMGSLVLDIFLQLESSEPRPVEKVFEQGKVTNLSGVSFYLGGCVGNTGIALQKLGIPTVLCGNVGNDFQGRIVRRIIEDANARMELRLSESSPTSVGIAMTPAGLDKITLFQKGASQEYSARDAARVPETDLFHFGYPTTMSSLYSNGGEELARLMKAVKDTGASVSMDTALPAIDSAHGQVDWRPILERTLKYVDIFVPSIEECLFMLDKTAYRERVRALAGADLVNSVTCEEVESVADAFLAMGAKIVLLKLGSKGLYLKTVSADSLADGGRAVSALGAEWAERELWMFPAWVENVVSTTGAGDTAIAGFLASLLHADNPEIALQTAVYTAALCVSSKDTTGLLKDYSEIKEAARGQKHSAKLALDAVRWRFVPEYDVYERTRDTL